MTVDLFRTVLAVAARVLGVMLALTVVALLVPPWMGTVFMLIAAAALIPSPFAYQWASRGKWVRTSMGWHLMSYMGVFSAVMVLAVAGAVASHFAVPHSDLPDWTRPLVWEAVGLVAWWRLIVVLRSRR